MSRVAKKPINLPAGVTCEVLGQAVNIKGPKGALSHVLHADVTAAVESGVLSVAPRGEHNMVVGVDQGYNQKREIVGVGYRAQAKGTTLNLTLGYSHPIEFAVPEGITVETPTQTEIWVRGIDKQQVGQVAANIRAYRRPEPYKGKGVKYAGEKILRKEAKKT